MTTGHDGDNDDDRLDALIRRAADRPVDEAALARRVLSQVRAQRQARDARFTFGGVAPRWAAAAFALVLVATPFAVAQMPLGRFDPAGDLAVGVALGAALGAPAFGPEFGPLLRDFETDRPQGGRG